MRAEVGSIIYRPRNTFFLGPGPLCDASYLAFPSRRLLPPVKRLDCAFDMRDLEEDSMALFELARGRCDALSAARFDGLSSHERARCIHDTGTQALLDDWATKVNGFCRLHLDLLRLDFTGARCVVGCCSLGVYIFEMMEGFHPNTFKRIEILGLPPQEHGSIRQVAQDSKSLSGTVLSFVDTPGCTCKVCSIWTPVSLLGLRGDRC